MIFCSPQLNSRFHLPAKYNSSSILPPGQKKQSTNFEMNHINWIFLCFTPLVPFWPSAEEARKKWIRSHSWTITPSLPPAFRKLYLFLLSGDGVERSLQLPCEVIGSDSLKQFTTENVLFLDYHGLSGGSRRSGKWKFSGQTVIRYDVDRRWHSVGSIAASRWEKRVYVDQRRGLQIWLAFFMSWLNSFAASSVEAKFLCFSENNEIWMYRCEV